MSPAGLQIVSRFVPPHESLVRPSGGAWVFGPPTDLLQGSTAFHCLSLNFLLPFLGLPLPYPDLPPPYPDLPLPVADLPLPYPDISLPYPDFHGYQGWTATAPRGPLAALRTMQSPRTARAW